MSPKSKLDVTYFNGKEWKTVKSFEWLETHRFDYNYSSHSQCCDCGLTVYTDMDEFRYTVYNTHRGDNLYCFTEEEKICRDVIE